MCSGIVSVSTYSNREILWIATAHHAKKHGDSTTYRRYTTSPNGDNLPATQQNSLRTAVAEMLANPDFKEGILQRCEAACHLSKVRHERSVTSWYESLLTKTCTRKGRDKDKYHAIWLVLTFYQQLQYPEWTAFAGSFVIPHSRFSDAACTMRWEYFGGMGEESDFSDERLLTWMREAITMAGLQSNVDLSNPESMAAAALMALDIPFSALATNIAELVINPGWNPEAKKGWTHHLLGKAAINQLETTLLPIKKTIATMKKLSAMTGARTTDLIKHGLYPSFIAGTVISKLRGINGLTRPTERVLEFLGEPLFPGIGSVFPAYRSSIQLHLLDQKTISQLSITNLPATNTALKRTFIQEALNIKNTLLKHHPKAVSSLLTLASESESARWTALPWTTPSTPSTFWLIANTVPAADETTEAPSVTEVSGTAAGAGAGGHS